MPLLLHFTAGGFVCFIFTLTHRAFLGRRVQSNFMNMQQDKSTLRLAPPSQWDGFIVDMIEWVSERAGFTYSLHSPSGIGERVQ